METTTQERTTMLSYKIPPLYERHHALDPLAIEEWHIAVGDIIQPDQLLVTLDTPRGFCDIYAPPVEELSGPHRVAFIPTPPDALLHLDDLLICFEPVSQDASK